jgi:translation initiation factor 2 alpha subunit (eIF-2alpha)
MARVSAKQRSYTVNLSQFDRYLRDKSAELKACVDVIDEIHTQFQTMFQRELVIWQERFAECYPELSLHRDEMPTELQAYLDRIEAEELERLQQEIADLETQLEELRYEMDADMTRAQAAIKTLQEANPDLNRREEQLQATVVQLQDEYAQAYEELEELERPSMSWLTNAGAISRVKRKQRELKAKQAKALEELRAVRQQWLTMVQETSETQGQLRESWQQAGITSAELQARYDHLVNNLEDLARQDGMQRALLEIDQTYPVEGELGEQLAEIARHNVIRNNYEAGLGASSETLGLLRGIRTGMEKFSQSVSNVHAQQRRYNLKQIKIVLPHDVGVVNQTWKQLQERVEDKQRMIENPLEFVDIAERYVIKRLTNEVIQRFFEQMGRALNLGTAAWD